MPDDQVRDVPQDDGSDVGDLDILMDRLQVVVGSWEEDDGKAICLYLAAMGHSALVEVCSAEGALSREPEGEYRGVFPRRLLPDLIRALRALDSELPQNAPHDG